MVGKTISKAISAAISAAMLVTSLPGAALAAPADSPKAADGDQNLLKLWYDEPASQGVNILSAGNYKPSAEDNNWQQHTLPIGNSFMGANVYGEIAKERLTFNQKTLWNGGPSTRRPNYNGGNLDKAAVWQETVSAFLEGNDAKGSSLAGGLVGEGESSGYGVYQSWGDIYLDYKDLANVTETTGYERNLDLTTGIANVDFEAGGTAYHREYFISYPDNVLAMKLTTDGTKTLNLNVSFPIDNGENAAEATSLSNDNLGKTGVQYDVDAQSGTIVNKASMQDNQLKMNSVLHVVKDKGTIAKGSDNRSLDISGAEEVTIYISANTDYKNVYPKYRTGETDQELADRVKKTVDDAVAKGYDTVKSRYLADYQELFGRVDLDLGQASSNKTTDQLLAAYKTSGENGATDAERRLLEVILYQYGRYLTIASSRDGDLPSNLQGVWQNRVGDSKKVPWGSDFHMNVNLQMNYWPTYSANLAECAIPIIDYVNSLREPGRVTAEKYFGIKSEAGEANGFSAHTQNSPFGWTCPGWSFDWGWSPAAVPWILQNCWEYYEYTGDLEYMRTHLYPMMKEETLLYDRILIDSGKEITLEDGTKSTRLVSAPTYSSEHGPRTLGNTYENVLIWQMYEDTITAAELLGVDSDLVARWKEIKKRLSPIEIGDSGQIKEWYIEGEYGKTENGEDISDFERGHRHMSHMLGLFPGDAISVENDKYMDAAILSMSDRGYTSTGWGMGQRINAWARTGRGNTAHLLIQNLFKGGIYPNLWDAHAPFQIDGNFGYTSGVNEMLMQSNAGYVNILPALPDVWSDGSVNGIVARGNFELGIKWANGKATEVQILSKNGGECIVQCTGVEEATITDSKGREITSEAVEGKANRIKFNTAKGMTYTISNMGEDLRLSAPKNTMAVKGDASGAVLTWDAVTGANSYNVYSKVGQTTKKLNDSDIAETTFKDTASYDDASTVDYMVAAVKDGQEGFRSDSFKLLPLVYPNKVEVIDETDNRVNYTGSWSGPYTGDGNNNYGGSMKFLQSAQGDEAVELQFCGTGVEILASKSSGNYNAQWKVYIDDTEAGVADCYSDTRQWQQVVFSKQGLSNGVHTVKLTTEGNAGKKIEVDAFVIYAEQNANVTVTYDLGGATGTAPAAQSGAARSTIKLAACDVPRFQCWTDGSNNYQAGADYMLHKDVTMTAVIAEVNTSDEYLSVSAPKSQWTATASSVEDDEHNASKAIDGNEGTWWHSNYGNGNVPTFGTEGTNNEFTIDFGTAVDIDMFEYVPRNNNSANGFITQYEILYSTSADGNFIKATSGTWENNTNRKQAIFAQPLQGVRRIQIKALATENGSGGLKGQDNTYIHVAEFNAYIKNPDYVPPILPTGITVSSETVELERGEIKDLGATITPDNASDKKMTYTSSDITVASVSPKGIVTANRYKSGTATITIKSSAVPTLTKTVNVTVSEPEEVEVTSIKLEKDRVVLKVNEETTVATSIEPFFGTDKTVTWNSSDTSKVTVTDGTIKAVAEGEAIITASTKNDKSATCKVVVVSAVIEANKSELNSTVSQLKSQYGDLKQYTKESADAYLEALKEAEQLLAYGADVLQTEIDNALSKLTEKANALQESNGVNKAWLQDELEKAKAKDLSGYLPSSTQKLTAAIAAAETVISNNNATQDQVDDALDELELSGYALVKKPDKSGLEAAIAAFEAKYTESELEKYSSAVKDAFDTAIAAARDVVDDQDATKEQVTAAVKDLGTADKNLSIQIDQEKAADAGVLVNNVVTASKDAYEAGADSYTEESWNTFITAYEAAKNPSEGLDAAALKKLADDLTNAQAALKLSAQKEEAISGIITTEGSLVSKGNTENYFATAWNNYVAAYNALKAAESAEGTEAAQLIKLQKALNDAKAKLKVDNDWVTAKNALGTALKDAKAAYDTKNAKNQYTTATWAPFQKAYDKANEQAAATIANSKAEDLSKLANDLNEKRKALKENTTSTDPKTENYVDEKGIRYTITNESKMTAIVEKGLDTKLTSVNIPNTIAINKKTYKVTEIKADAFKKFTKIKTVTIGKNVIKIGDNSFNGCTSITKLAVNGTGKIKFGKQSFNGCKKLNTITLKTKKAPTFGKKVFAKTNSKGVKVKFAKGTKAREKNKMKNLFKKAGIKKVK